MGNPEMEIVALLGEPRQAREAALDAVQRAAKAAPVAVLMAAVAVAPPGDARASGWLRRLSRPEAEEEALAVWDEPLVRRAGLALALRAGERLGEGLQRFLMAELDLLSGDDPEDLADLGAAVEAVSRVAPQEALSMAGFCAGATVSWLQSLSEPNAAHHLSAYSTSLSASLARHALPQPADANALFLMELMDTPLGARLLLGMASDDAPVSMLASRIIRLCVEVGLSGAEGAEAFEGDTVSQRVDADEIRGLLDAHQIPYNDVSGDAWSATLPYKDALGEKGRAPLTIGLTGRRVILRAAIEGATQSHEAILRQNRYTGLASFSLDPEGRLTIGVEMAREGVGEVAFGQALEDMTKALEWVL